MNCQDIQHCLLAAPSCDDVEVRGHLAGCERCRQSAADLIRFERMIEAAALSIDAPEGLSARVLLHPR
jgi:hypothetical protein